MGFFDRFKGKAVKSVEQSCTSLDSFLNSERIQRLQMEHEKLLPMFKEFVVEVMGSGELANKLPKPNCIFVAENESYIPIFYPPTIEGQSGKQVMLDYCLDKLFSGYRETNEAEGKVIYIRDKCDDKGDVLYEYISPVRNVKFGIYEVGKTHETGEGKKILKKPAGLEMLMLFAYNKDILNYFVKYFGQIFIDDFEYVMDDNGIETSGKICLTRKIEDKEANIEFVPIDPDDEAVVHNDLCDFMVDLDVIVL